MTPAEAARTFAEALLGGHGELLAGCWVTVTSFERGAPGPQTSWVPARAGSLTSAVLARAGGSDTTGVYVGVGLTRARPPGAKRLDVEAVAGLAYFWADIDIAGPARGLEKAYAPTLETAVGIANSLGITPTVVTNTGHGIQAFWRLNEPWIFGAVDADDDGVPVIDPDRIEGDRKAAKALAWEFVTSLRIKASQMGGWYIDAVGDLARLMRMPGSVNRKIEGEELPVTVITADPAAVYDREAIEAVIAPRVLLDPYRHDQVAATASLAGVDLVRLWAEVQSSPDHIPRWLADLFESGWDRVLESVFTGAQDKRYHNDDSEIDMALVAAALRMDMTAAQAAQIVMARRCRVGRKVAKVDPSERVDYLERTIGKVAARIRARGVIAESYESGFDAVMAVPDEDDDPPPDADPPGGSPPDPGPVPAPPVSSPDSGDDLAEPEDERVSLRESAPVDIVAVRADQQERSGVVRLGLDATTPDRPDATARTLGKQLAGLLGLPQGVFVWGAGKRRQESHDEIRLWLMRDVSCSSVHGGRWQAGQVASTRWHPKSDWDTRASVEDMLFHDLHLVAEPVPQRQWKTEGRLRLYELAQPMRAATPEETAHRGIITLLKRSPGTAAFSTAVNTRDPWISPDGTVWVALDSLRHFIAQMGVTPQKAEALYDTLDELCCKVECLAVAEGHRMVRDELQWVRIDDTLISAELAEQVCASASQRDAQDRRSELRVIGPTS